LFGVRYFNYFNIAIHKKRQIKMRKFVLLLLIPVFYACTDSSHQLKTMQAKIDELDRKLADSYKPGFGEFMGNIQVHHAKLWFAGINNNWRLADFELHEIQESLQDLEKYQTGRNEIKSLPMIYPALDSLNEVIKKQDLVKFKKSFNTLTNTCNKCHKAVNYEFNDVKIPDTPPFTNQLFKKSNK
jgi:hypothetical protein